MQPNWASIQKDEQTAIYIIAQPSYQNGETTRPYNLKLEASGEKITVIEDSINKEENFLPTSCPCRHINEGGKFCLGVEGGLSVKCTVSADHWWKHLDLYLQCQELADRTGEWPPEYEAGHGNSAQHQLKAEDFSDLLGCGDDYRLRVSIRQNPLRSLGIIWKTRKKKDGQIAQFPKLNMKIACPLNCIDKKKSKIIRKKCKKLNIWKLLLLAETRRYKKALEFQNSYGQPDCNFDMKYCEFKKELKY